MQTRGAVGRGWTLVTPENHYPSRLPSLPGAAVIKLVTPRLSPARFGQYLVAYPADVTATGRVDGEYETFLYGLEGAVTVLDATGQLTLSAGTFAYLPAGAGFDVVPDEDEASRFLWLKRRYEPFGELDPPPALRGHRDDEPFAETSVPGFTRRELIPPDDPRHDFNISLLRFEAGIGLDKVEIHDEEHGLWMTEGAGDYLLDRETLEVRAGDFIYMAPYCPQSFTAFGAGPAEYLLYKDVFRDGF